MSTYNDRTLAPRASNEQLLKLFTGNGEEMTANVQDSAFGFGVGGQMLRGSGYLNTDDNHISSRKKDDDEKNEISKLRRALNLAVQKIATPSFIDGLIKNINLEIGEIDTQITHLQSRQLRILSRIEELDQEEEKLQEEREALVDEQEIHERALEEDQNNLITCGQDVAHAEIAVTEAERNVILAQIEQTTTGDTTSPELDESKQELEEAQTNLEIAEIRFDEQRAIVLSGRMTSDEIQRNIQNIDLRIDAIKTERENLINENDEINNQIETLQQREFDLIESRNTLLYLKNEIANGAELTEKEVLDQLPQSEQDRVNHNIDSFVSQHNDWEELLEEQRMIRKMTRERDSEAESVEVSPSEDSASLPYDYWNNFSAPANFSTMTPDINMSFRTAGMSRPGETLLNQRISQQILNPLDLSGGLIVR